MFWAILQMFSMISSNFSYSCNQISERNRKVYFNESKIFSISQVCSICIIVMKKNFRNKEEQTRKSTEFSIKISHLVFNFIIRIIFEYLLSEVLNQTGIIREIKV